MIIGFDWHDEQTIEEDFQYLLSLRPAFSQFMAYSPCPQTPLYQRMIDENRLLDIPYKFHDGFHALFKHPHLSSQRFEELIQELFQREYEELGPSVCRVLEVQLTGYKTLHESPNPLFRARAREYRKLCLEIYPIMKIAIRKAPSRKVREYLKVLKEKVEHEFQIPTITKLKEGVAPAFALYSQLKDSFFPNPQPRTVIHRYRLN